MRLTSALQTARTDIRQGRFQRSMALMTAASAVVSGFEAYVQHQRGDFDDPWMWTPVWLTPPTVAAGLAAVVSKRAAWTALPLTSAASLIDGIVGFGYHLRGIARLPGGYKLGRYNLVMGPPVFAPLLVGTVGVTGLIASMLRREPLRRSPGRLRLPQRVALKGRTPRIETEVEQGRFQQGMAIVSAIFAVLAGGEAYFEHLRGSYNQAVMWTPVWVTPPMAGAALGSIFSRRVAKRVLPLAAMVTFFDGLLGFVLHLRGIYRMPGRFANLRFNVTMGPPLFAPLLFTAVGLLGMISSLLRRSR